MPKRSKLRQDASPTRRSGSPAGSPTPRRSRKKAKIEAPPPTPTRPRSTRLITARENASDFMKAAAMSRKDGLSTLFLLTAVLRALTHNIFAAAKNTATAQTVDVPLSDSIEEVPRRQTHGSSSGSSKPVPKPRGRSQAQQPASAVHVGGAVENFNNETGTVREAPLNASSSPLPCLSPSPHESVTAQVLDHDDRVPGSTHVPAPGRGTSELRQAVPRASDRSPRKEPALVPLSPDRAVPTVSVAAVDGGSHSQIDVDVHVDDSSLSSGQRVLRHSPEHVGLNVGSQVPSEVAGHAPPHVPLHTPEPSPLPAQLYVPEHISSHIPTHVPWPVQPPPHAPGEVPQHDVPPAHVHNHIPTHAHNLVPEHVTDDVPLRTPNHSQHDIESVKHAAPPWRSAPEESIQMQVDTLVFNPENVVDANRYSYGHPHALGSADPRPRFDFQLDFASNIYSQVAYDGQSQLASGDVVPSAASNVFLQPASQVHPIVARDVHSEVASDLHVKVALHAHPEVPSDVHLDVASNVDKASDSPTASGTRDNRNDNDSDDNFISGSLFDDPSLHDSKAPGRISDDNHVIIRKFFDKMIADAKEASQATGLAVPQIIDICTASRARNHQKGGNVWNGYESFFAAHKDAELARLPTDVVEGAKTNDKSDLVSLCYDAFKQHHGKEKAHNILAKWVLLQALSNAGGMTVGQRKADFNKALKRLINDVEYLEAVHGYSGMLTLVGDLVNSDAGLAHVYMTKNAEGFIELRLRMDRDTYLSHFKAQVYHKVSLAVADLAEGSVQVPTESLQSAPPLKAEAKPEKSVFEKAAELRARPTRGSSATTSAPAAASSSKVEEDDEVDLPEPEDRARFIKNGLLKSLRTMGIAGQDAAKAWSSNFPWRTLVHQLAHHGLALYNYPENVAWPTDPPRRKSTSRAGRPPRPKGITDIGTEGLIAMVGVMMNPKHPHPLHFKPHGHKSALRDSKMPVIYGAPPAHDSSHVRGRRLFVNGKSDRLGFPRLTEAPANEDDEDVPGPMADTGSIVPSNADLNTDSDADTDTDSDADADSDNDSHDNNANGSSGVASKRGLPSKRTGKFVKRFSKTMTATAIPDDEGCSSDGREIVVAIPTTPIRRAERAPSPGARAHYISSGSECEPTPGPSRPKKRPHLDDNHSSLGSDSPFAEVLGKAIKPPKPRAVDKGKGRDKRVQGIHGAVKTAQGLAGPPAPEHRCVDFKDPGTATSAVRKTVQQDSVSQPQDHLVVPGAPSTKPQLALHSEPPRRDPQLVARLHVPAEAPPEPPSGLHSDVLAEARAEPSRDRRPDNLAAPANTESQPVLHPDIPVLPHQDSRFDPRSHVPAAAPAEPPSVLHPDVPVLPHQDSRFDPRSHVPTAAPAEPRGLPRQDSRFDPRSHVLAVAPAEAPLTTMEYQHAVHVDVPAAPRQDARNIARMHIQGDARAEPSPSLPSSLLAASGTGPQPAVPPDVPAPRRDPGLDAPSDVRAETRHDLQPNVRAESGRELQDLEPDLRRHVLVVPRPTEPQSDIVPSEVFAGLAPEGNLVQDAPWPPPQVQRETVALASGSQVGYGRGYNVTQPYWQAAASRPRGPEDDAVPSQIAEGRTPRPPSQHAGVERQEPGLVPGQAPGPGLAQQGFYGGAPPYGNLQYDGCPPGYRHDLYAPPYGAYPYPVHPGFAYRPPFFPPPSSVPMPSSLPPPSLHQPLSSHLPTSPHMPPLAGAATHAGYPMSANMYPVPSPSSSVTYNAAYQYAGPGNGQAGAALPPQQRDPWAMQRQQPPNAASGFNEATSHPPAAD
ncbi:hypothetical protein C8T65DRAFT_744409 [Cerioporus squamosus]|nr:hypothetical protein C8T65DRAFT_744409 [Cerioporus squamosus]